jgi:hypothetical protein
MPLRFGTLHFSCVPSHHTSISFHETDNPEGLDGSITNVKALAAQPYVTAGDGVPVPSTQTASIGWRHLS